MFLKKLLRGHEASTASQGVARALELRAVWEKATSPADQERALCQLAVAFSGAFQSVPPSSIESSFGPCAGVCLAWCNLLVKTFRDVWDEHAEKSRNASVCMFLFNNAQDHLALDVIVALQVCAKMEGNVPSFIESGLCVDLIHFLEACLEAAEGVLNVAPATNGALQTLALFGNLLSCPSFCDALAGSPSLFLLFTLPVRESLPHNTSFCMSCAKMIHTSVSSWSPAVIASLHEGEWVKFLLSRLDSEYSHVPPECVVIVASILVSAIGQSAEKDGSLVASFVSADGYEHFVSIVRRFANGQMNQVMDLIDLVVRLVYVGKELTEAPDANLFLLSAAEVEAPKPRSASDAAIVAVELGKRVRNREAVGALQRIFTLCNIESVREKVCEVCFGVFRSHARNYLLLQQQHIFAEFLERFEELSESLRKKILAHVINVEKELHFVPFHELVNLSLLLDKHLDVMTVLQVYQTVRAFIEVNPRYRGYFEQAGLLHVLGKLFRSFSAQSDVASYNALLDLLNCMLVDNSSNCVQFIKTGGCESMSLLLENSCTRPAALKNIQQLLVCGQEKSADVFTVVVGLVRNCKGDRLMASDILVALAPLLSNRWVLKESFRETGGFVSIVSVLMTLENAFSIAHSSKEEDLQLLLMIFDTCTCAIAGHAENRAFFCNQILPSIVGSLRLTGILVTGKECRRMVLALIRMMTENVDFSSGSDATSEYRRYAKVQNGDIALILLELMEFLNDKNKFFLMDCLSDIVWSLWNKEALSQREVLLLILRRFEDLLCRTPNQLVNRLLDFVIRIASHRISQTECISFLRILRRHGYPAHLFRALRRMAEKSRAPPLTELNLASSGFACLKILPGNVQLSQGYSWPPASGFSVVFWVCIEDFGRHPVDIFSILSSDESLLFRISISATGKFLFLASKLVDISSFHFEQRRWYHVALTWQKKRFSSPDACLYVDGAAVWSGTVPPLQYAEVPTLSFVFGTPMEEKLVGCKQLWWLGPFYVTDEYLDPKLILTMFSLGPGYYFNLQGPFDQFQVTGTVTERALDLVQKYQFDSPAGCLHFSNLHGAPLPEDRIVVALHARSVQSIAGSDGKLLKNSTGRAGSTFADVLMLGGAAAFENQGLAHSLHKVGGMTAVIAAVAEAQDSFLDALRFAAACIQSSWRNARQLEETGFDMFTHALVLQSHRLSAEAMDILWELVGLRPLDLHYAEPGYVPPQSPRMTKAFEKPLSPSISSRVRTTPTNGVVANLRAFSSLFLSFVPWKQTSLPLQVKVFEDMMTLLIDNKHKVYNMWCLMQVNAVEKVLDIVMDESVSVELFAPAIDFLSCMVRLEPAKVLEQLTLFLLCTIPGVAEKYGASVFAKTNTDTMRVVSLRNLILEMLHVEIVCNAAAFEQLVTPEWVAHWTSRSLHTSSRQIGLRILASVLHVCPSFAKQFSRGGWKWLTATASRFNALGDSIYVLVAIMYGLPASSIPTKLRSDFCDLHTLFPPDKANVVNSDCLSCILAVLTSAAQSYIEVQLQSSKSAFVPIGKGDDADDHLESQTGERPSSPWSKQQQPQAASGPKPSIENLIDRSAQRSSDPVSFTVLLKYMLQAFETNEEFRVAMSSDIVLDQLVRLMYVVNSAMGPTYVAPLNLSGRSVNLSSSGGIGRDASDAMIGLQKIGQDVLLLLTSMLHFWARSDAKGEQRVLDVISFVPPDMPATQVSTFCSKILTDLLLKLKHNITLKDLESSPKVVDGISRVANVACDLVGMGFFVNGDKVVWECLIELLEHGEGLMAETRGFSLGRFGGKSKLAPLFKPLNRSVLMLLAREDQRGWIVNQMVYQQRLVLNHVNDDRNFLHGLVHFLTGFMLSDERDLRDGSMALFKLLLIVWEPIMKECLVLPSAKNGVPDSDLLTDGFDRLLQGVMGFQDWLVTKMDAVRNVLNETASKWWSKVAAADSKTFRDALKAMQSRQQKNSTKRNEREAENASVVAEYDSVRQNQIDRSRTAWLIPRKIERSAAQERSQLNAIIWNKMLRLMEMERGVWGPEESQWNVQKWKLAAVEGAYRMRLRVEENEWFVFPQELLLLSNNNNNNNNSNSGSASSSRRPSTAAMSDAEESDTEASYEMGGPSPIVVGGGNSNITPKTPDRTFSAISSSEKVNVVPRTPEANRLPSSSSGGRENSNYMSPIASEDSSVSPQVALEFRSAPEEDHDSSSADEAGNEMEEEAKLDRLQRFLEKDDRVHFRSMFNVGRISGMSRTAAVLLVCQDHVYVVDDFRVDFEAQELVEVEKPKKSTSPSVASGGSSRSASPAPSSSTQSSPTLSRTRSSSMNSKDIRRTLLLGHELRKWSYGEITEIAQKRYLLQNIAVEIFSNDGRNELLSFGSRKEKNEAWKQLNRSWETGKAKVQSLAVEDVGGGAWKRMSAMVMGSGSKEENMTHRWRMGQVSNFEYLMFLNACAGRSYNDLTQYPVFPWILADYESADLDLTNARVYRDLSKPMGAQTAERASIVKERFEDYIPTEHDAPAFHYGTHYSSAAAVLYYLIRLEPFTSQFLWELQGGRFDQPDRTFSSMLGTWKSASGATGSTSDVKEVIPEFFVTSLFLKNSNRFNLGVRTNGALIDHVELPPWAGNDALLFILANRMALESEYVSQHLHEWIDLIFGFKQRGPEAVAALNVFHFLSYEGEVNIEDITDPVQRKATMDAILNFGQTPRQLFFKPHPAKLATEAYRGGLEHPFSRLAKGKASNMLQFELLAECGFAVERLQMKAGGVVGVCKKRHAFIGTKIVRADMPDHSVRLYDGAGATPVLLDVVDGLHDGAVRVMSSNAEHIVTGGADGVVVLSKASVRKSGPFVEIVKKLSGHRKEVTAVAVSQVWNIFVSASEDCSTFLWDLRTQRLVRQLPHGGTVTQKKGKSSPVTNIAIDDKTGFILCATRTMLELFDVNGELLASLAMPSVAVGDITSVCFLESQYVVLGAVTLMTGHSDGGVRLYRMDATRGSHINVGGMIDPLDEKDRSANKTELPLMFSEVYAYTAHSSPVTALTIISDGLLSADTSGKIVKAFASSTMVTPSGILTTKST